MEPDHRPTREHGGRGLYLDFFGLREEPFSLTSDPGFLYLSRQHREALAQVEYGITQRKGFVEVSGEVGAGKTTVCKALLERLGPSCATAFIINSDLPEIELLEAVLWDFGLVPAVNTKFGMLKTLMNFLLQEAENGRNAALILDEAQDLKVSTLEMIRLLSNLETNKEKLFQIVLVGQPEMAQLLSRPELRQLRQRIAVRCRINPLSPNEVAEYVYHRLKVAGANGTVELADDALARVVSFSGGIPRLINLVCDRALLLGFVRETRTITSDIVEKSILELDGVAAADALVEPRPLLPQS